MTYDNFIKQIVDYYGPYPTLEVDGKNVSKVQGFVIAYLKNDIREDRLKELLRIVLYYHPHGYKAPCIASIEAAIEKAIKNNKTNADLRIVRTYSQQIEKPTPDEVKETDEILKQQGALAEMMRKNAEKQKEWKE